MSRIEAAEQQDAVELVEQHDTRGDATAWDTAHGVVMKSQMDRSPGCEP
jgi:hypothetical protein